VEISFIYVAAVVLKKTPLFQDGGVYVKKNIGIAFIILRVLLVIVSLAADALGIGGVFGH
jgi:hypothetical protein